MSSDDRSFCADFEEGRLGPESFDHRAHLRFAYALLTEDPPEVALSRLRSVLTAFLARHGIPAEKYHETLTQAWILAVYHFMLTSPPAASADAFLLANPALLDPAIMLSHYSQDRLFSQEARAAFVEPDRAAIPRHGQRLTSDLMKIRAERQVP